MDEKTLDIQINTPNSNTIQSGAIEITLTAKGPNELGEMSLSIIGDNWGKGFPISNNNCIAGSSSSGGSSSEIAPISKENICKRYHICEDSTEVQYCEMVKKYDNESILVGFGCVCKQNPEELCTPTTTASDSNKNAKEPTKIETKKSSGSSTSQSPIICNGCIIGDNCVPLGYRTGNNYCTIESELANQKNDASSCNNSYQCKSNMCENNQCGRYCEGCKDENENCIPFGTRLENHSYCNIDKTIYEQNDKDSACINNYECVSNLCIDDACIEKGFFQKIANWFRRLF